MNEFVGALNSLSKNEDVKDSFTLGLLHSKIGEYELAITQFETALQNKLDVNKTTQALLLAYLKNSNFKKAAALINHMPRSYQWKKYPIEVFLKPRLFDIDLAQNYFKEKFFFDKEKIYSLIFIFLPIKCLILKKVLRLSKKVKQV
jgi:tetratricopeptide (TPR) repeat protein